jgi:hypothetical protein
MPKQRKLPVRFLNYNMHKCVYRRSDGKLIEVSACLTGQHETVGSLLEIGNMLFKDSRDITQEEAAAMHTYFKRKYKKA